MGKHLLYLIVRCTHVFLYFSLKHDVYNNNGIYIPWVGSLILSQSDTYQTQLVHNLLRNTLFSCHPYFYCLILSQNSLSLSLSPSLSLALSPKSGVYASLYNRMISASKNRVHMWMWAHSRRKCKIKTENYWYHYYRPIWKSISFRYRHSVFYSSNILSALENSLNSMFQKVHLISTLTLLSC